MYTKTIQTLTNIIVGLIVIIILLIIGFIYSIVHNEQQNANHTICGIEPWCGTSGTSAGDALFRMNCASCHSLNKRLIGPPLNGVMSRVPTEKWFDDFVRNEKELLKSNDAYITQLHKIDTSHTFTHYFNHFSSNDLEELKDLFSP